MDFEELAADLSRGKLYHVYLLCGEETYFLRKAKELILKTLFPDPGEMDSALTRLDGDLPTNEFIATLNTAPFLADKNVVLADKTRLFREKKGDAEESEKKSAKADKDTEKLIRALAELPSYAYVIFLTTDKVDKRRKLYKSLLKFACVMEAAPFRPWEAQSAIRAMAAKLPKPLERDALTHLTNLLGVMQQVSLDFVEQELRKLQLYASGETVTKADVIASFSALPEISIFALTDAISARDAAKSLTLLAQELKNGTAPNMILAILVRHVRQLWQAKDLLAHRVPMNDLGAKLGINPYIAKKLGQAAAKFDATVLKTALLALADADYKLKTGQGDVEMLESTLIMLCHNRPLIAKEF